MSLINDDGNPQKLFFKAGERDASTGYMMKTFDNLTALFKSSIELCEIKSFKLFEPGSTMEWANELKVRVNPTNMSQI